jgi:hypothetical protein
LAEIIITFKKNNITAMRVPTTVVGEVHEKSIIYISHSNNKGIGNLITIETIVIYNMLLYYSFLYALYSNKILSAAYYTVTCYPNAIK